MNYYVSSKQKADFKTLEEALSSVKEYDTLYLLDDEYYGKYYITTPNLTIIGKDSMSMMHYDVASGHIIKDIHGGDGVKTYGTTGSASTTVKPSAINLHVKNVIFKNSFVRTRGFKGTQNVAFKTEAIGGVYTNCKFIGTQDTLYIDAGLNIFNNCYIEGDVDFVFGAGDAIIKNSTIKLLHVLDSNAYLCAPDTYTSYNYGYLFYNCNILSEGSNLKYLGRAWYPSGAKEPVWPRAMFMDSKFPSDLNPIMITMHEGDPTNFSLYIKNCTKDNEVITNCDDEISKRYLEFLNNNNEVLF